MKIQSIKPISTPVESAPKAAATTPKAGEAAGEVRTSYDSAALGNKAPQQVTYTRPQKLTADQVEDLHKARVEQETALLKAMAGNAINQANSWLKSVGEELFPGQSDFFDRFELPELATTQEGALAAISEGGAYSVDAVATRIFDMAKAMAGDDPAKLLLMQESVKKGFAAAGVDFKRTAKQELPDISKKTYDEVMKRFEERLGELGAVTTEKE